jgi:hypothetical protein
VLDNWEWDHNRPRSLIWLIIGSQSRNEIQSQVATRLDSDYKLNKGENKHGDSWVISSFLTAAYVSTVSASVSPSLLPFHELDGQWTTRLQRLTLY